MGGRSVERPQFVVAVAVVMVVVVLVIVNVVVVVVILVIVNSCPIQNAFLRKITWSGLLSDTHRRTRVASGCIYTV